MTEGDSHRNDALILQRRARWGLGKIAAGLILATAGVVIARRTTHRTHKPNVHQHSLRRVRDGVAILAGSVLADSAMEHFRGGFHNRAMFAAPIVATAELAVSLAEPRADGTGRSARAGHAVSMIVGATGLGFHLYNVTKRPGGLSWNNLFYAAPLGAPAALIIAGMLGFTAEAIAVKPPHSLRNGRLLAALSGGALLGETAEVALLHFRGAFHNPAMYLPVTLPPLIGALLLGQALRPDPRHHRPMRGLLNSVGVLGLIGTAFHIYGVSRNMGGWSNWRQTVLAGPPTPAPISFTGLALAGHAALDLLEDGVHTR